MPLGIARDFEKSHITTYCARKVNRKGRKSKGKSINKAK